MRVILGKPTLKQIRQRIMKSDRQCAMCEMPRGIHETLVCYKCRYKVARSSSFVQLLNPIKKTEFYKIGEL